MKEVFETDFENECALQQFRVSFGNNEPLRRRMEEIEKIRISFLSTLLGRSGLKFEDANIKARQIYRFFLGTLVSCDLEKPNKKEKEKISKDFLALFGEV